LGILDINGPFEMVLPAEETDIHGGSTCDDAQSNTPMGRPEAYPDSLAAYFGWQPMDGEAATRLYYSLL
jgi:hypothetical protein